MLNTVILAMYFKNSRKKTQNPGEWYLNFDLKTKSYQLVTKIKFKIKSKNKSRIIIITNKTKVFAIKNLLS